MERLWAYGATEAAGFGVYLPLGFRGLGFSLGFRVEGLGFREIMRVWKRQWKPFCGIVQGLLEGSGYLVSRL